MRLFKIALAVSAVSAGDKYQATEQERKCLQECKRDTNCQGQNITKNDVPECIQHCRDECTGDRKEIIGSVFARSSSKLHKIALRKKQNKEKRGEHREMVKAAQPPPMIKEIHEIRDKHNDEIAELFLNCLKHQKDSLGCAGHGPGEAWDCKREMVSNCLDENEGYVGMGSHKIVQLGRRFRESEEKAEETKGRLVALQSMANDVSLDKLALAEEVEEDMMEKADKNKHNKVRVSDVRKAMSEDAKRKAARKSDTSDVGLDVVEGLTYQGEADEQEDAEAEARAAEEAYEAAAHEESEDAEMESHYKQTEEEEAEATFSFDSFDSTDMDSGFDFGGFDDFSEQAEMANDVGLGEAEEAEFEEVEEAKEEQEDEEDEEKAPKGKKEKQPLFKLQASNSNKKDKPKKAENNLKVHHGIKNLDKEAYIQEMCTCRTSMEHYRIKNYLAKHLSSDETWVHKEDTCKWCAYPNSKKCWQCQQHWGRASQTSGKDQVRNQQIDMACLLYVRSVRSGKYGPMNSKNNDPCSMKKVHDGSFNNWHAHGQMKELFDQYHDAKQNSG